MKEFIRKLLIVVCVAVFAYSAFQLGKIFYGYYEIEKETEAMIGEYVTENNETEEFNPLDRTIDFDKLSARNSDVAGWLYIPDTKIDEAILKGETNDTYIRTDIDGNYDYAGSLFIDAANSKDLTDVNTIIYGHNMKNGSRFHDVRYYIINDKDYMNEHPYAYIYLPDGSVNVYEIFASAVIAADSDLYNITSNYSKYVDKVLSNAKYKNSVSDEEAPIIMLSTCHSSEEDSRYVVFARLKENLK